jgi:hypothetical protein
LCYEGTDKQGEKILALDGVSSKLHALTNLPPGTEASLYTVYRRLKRSQSYSGSRGEEKIPNIQSIASHITDLGIMAHKIYIEK